MKFEVNNAYFGYNKKDTIINNVCIEINSGEILSILGPNGVGKTTFLKCMIGLIPWNKGETLLNGKNIKHINNKELWKSIAYVPQAKGMPFSYTLEEMIQFGRSAYIGNTGSPKKEDIEICNHIMNLLKIYHLKDKLCNKVSGGELQMALIARALVANPQILILDEPESNLDFRNQLIILETIKDLSKKLNISCIFNTHYPTHALKISDTSLLINKGGNTYFGKTKDMITTEKMEEIFMVKVDINNVQTTNCIYDTVTALSIL